MKTYSDHHPCIERLQGKILFPHNIQKKQVTDDDGSCRTVYEYDLIRIPDRGQTICAYEDFKRSNYGDLRRARYGTWQEQMDLVFQGAWQQHIASVKAEFPKPAKSVK